MVEKGIRQKVRASLLPITSPTRDFLCTGSYYPSPISYYQSTISPLNFYFLIYILRYFVKSTQIILDTVFCILFLLFFLRDIT